MTVIAYASNGRDRVRLITRGVAYSFPVLPALTSFCFAVLFGLGMGSRARKSVRCLLYGWRKPASALRARWLRAFWSSRA